MVVAMQRKPRFATSAWRRSIAAAFLVVGIALPSSALAHEERVVVVDHEATPMAVHFASHEGRPRLGVGVVEMTPALRRFFKAPEDAGILVSQVEDDSPAKASGIKVGDVIVSVAGEQVGDVGDVHRALAEQGGDEKITVVVIRNKKKLRKKVKVERKSIPAPEFVAPPMPPAMPPGFANPKRKLLEKELERTHEQLREIEKRLEKLEAKKRKNES
jgi:membrane-associated protease RseP (regulator of RpoE activity)